MKEDILIYWNSFSNLFRHLEPFFTSSSRTIFFFSFLFGYLFCFVLLLCYFSIVFNPCSGMFRNIPCSWFYRRSMQFRLVSKRWILFLGKVRLVCFTKTMDFKLFDLFEYLVLWNRQFHTFAFAWLILSCVLLLDARPGVFV